MKKKLAVTLLALNTLFLYGEDGDKKQLKGDGIIAVEKIKHGKESVFLNSESSVKFNLYVALNDVENIKIVYKNKGKKIIKDMVLMETEGKSVLYSVDIGITDKNISYYFILKDGSKKVYYGEKVSNKEKECKPLVIDIEKMETAVIPSWVKDSNIGYEIVIDRFRNGNSENDPLFNEATYKTINFKTAILENGVRSSELLENKSRIQGVEEFKLNSWGSNWNKREMWEQKATVNAKEYRRYGGDIKGIKDKLAYLKEIGVDTIFISPPFVSGSSYKDDVIEFNHIDPEFGTIAQTGEFSGDKIKSTKGASEYIMLESSKSEINKNNIGEGDISDSWFFTESDMIFIDLVKEAHKNGIRVIVEIPSAYISCNSSKFRDVLKNGAESVYADWFIFKEWKNRDKGEDVWNPYISYEGNSSYGVIEKDGKKMRRKWVKVTGDINKEQMEELLNWNKLNADYLGISGQTEIAKLNFNNKSVVEYYKKSLLKWIEGFNSKIEDKVEESDGIDGIKFTGIDEIEGKTSFEELVKELKTVNKELYITAEIGYENRKEFINGKYDGCLNYGIGYNIYKLIVNKSKEKEKPSEFADKINSLYNGYPKDIMYNSLNIIDSSNSDRAFSMTINIDRDYDRMNGVENEDYKSIRPDLYSENAVNLFKSMVVMQMILPGVPIVYYGNENGMWGADDPENRKPMLWDDIKYDRESDTLAKYKKESKKFGDEVEIDEANGRVFYENKSNEGIAKFYKAIIKFRAENKELVRSGDVKFVYADDAVGAIAVERKSGKKSTVALINLTDKENTVKIPLESGDYQSIFSEDKYSVVNKVMEVKLKAREGVILIKK